VTEALNNKHIIAFIDKCIEETNKRAISRAQYVRKYIVVPNDFSIAGTEFTSTMKMRRKIIEKKYEAELEKLYADAKL